jgi:hypothetical protein
MELVNRLYSGKPSLDWEPLLRELNNPKRDSTFNVNIYHGTRTVDTTLSILDAGSIKSPARRKEGENTLDITVGNNRLVEDILHLFGEPEEDLNIVKLTKDNREIFREHGSPESNQFIDTYMEDYFDSGFGSPMLEDQGVYSPLRDFCVSVGDEITYYVVSRAEEEGVALEFSVPRDSVINYGVEGNVPGKIPLEYATAIYYGTEVSEDDIEKLETHPATQTHGLTIESTEVYREESDLF